MAGTGPCPGSGRPQTSVSTYRDWTSMTNAKSATSGMIIERGDLGEKWERENWWLQEEERIRDLEEELLGLLRFFVCLFFCFYYFPLPATPSIFVLCPLFIRSHNTSN